MSLLGGIGSGLSAFAGTYLQQKQSEENRKRQEQMIQLQGLQSLLGQDDLPNDVYMNAIGAMATLTKDPRTQAVYDHLQQQMSQQVPLGPEKETLDSRFQRLLGGVSGEADKAQGLVPTEPPAPVTAPSNVRVGDVPRNIYNQYLALPGRIAEREASMKPIQVVDPTTKETVLINPSTGLEIGRNRGQLPSVATKQIGVDAAKSLQQQRHQNALVRMGLSAQNAAAKPIKQAAFTALYAAGLDPFSPELPQEKLDEAYKNAAIGIEKREEIKAQQLATLDKLRQRQLNQPSGQEMQVFRGIEAQKAKFDQLSRDVIKNGTVGRSKLALASELQNAAQNAATDTQRQSMIAQAQKAKADGEALIAQEQAGKMQLGQLAAQMDATFPGYVEVTYDDESGWPTVKVGALPQPKAEGINPPPSKSKGGQPRRRGTYNVDLNKYGLNP